MSTDVIAAMMKELGFVTQVNVTQVKHSPQLYRFLIPLSQITRADPHHTLSDSVISSLLFILL